eukprot:scaffold275986_cov28-Tisochrysis_lutea.AAC.5
MLGSNIATRSDADGIPRPASASGTSAQQRGRWRRGQCEKANHLEADARREDDERAKHYAQRGTVGWPEDEDGREDRAAPTQREQSDQERAVLRPFSKQFVRHMLSTHRLSHLSREEAHQADNDWRFSDEGAAGKECEGEGIDSLLPPPLLVYRAAQTREQPRELLFTQKRGERRSGGSRRANGEAVGDKGAGEDEREQQHEWPCLQHIRHTHRRHAARVE